VGTPVASLTSPEICSYHLRGQCQLGQMHSATRKSRSWVAAGTAFVYGSFQDRGRTRMMLKKSRLPSSGHVSDGLGVSLRRPRMRRPPGRRCNRRLMMGGCNDNHDNTYTHSSQWRTPQSYQEAPPSIREPGITSARAILQAREEQVRR
jgi:hypothetical protein